MYDSFSQGYLTLDDMKKAVFEETGINLDEEIEKKAGENLIKAKESVNKS